MLTMTWRDVLAAAFALVAIPGPWLRRRVTTREDYYEEAPDGRTGAQLRQEDYESHEVWPDGTP